MNKNPNIFKRNQQQNFRFVQILNYGAFIAGVDLYYMYQGQRYEFKTDYLLMLQEFSVNVPLEATQVDLFVSIDTFFDYTLLFEKHYPTADDACFLLYGVSFAAKYKPIPCTGPGVIQNILPQALCVQPQVIPNLPNPCNCNPLLNRKSPNPPKKSNENDNSNIKVCNVQGRNIYS